MTDLERDLFGGYTETWRNEWRGMPAFRQERITPWKTLTVHFDSEEAVSHFDENVSHIYKDKWCWYPGREWDKWGEQVWVGGPPAPRYPVFVPSKGRHHVCLTMRAFERAGIPYTAVVEPQEAEQYAAALGEDRILVLPHRDKGLVVTRNWIWDHARDLGVERFWTFDDNIYGLYRLHDNAKRLVFSAATLCAIEDFVERYESVPVAGMQYTFFMNRREARPPFLLNTRVYSNMLIETRCANPAGVPYRNEGFYNDDTDLCLRMLKDGHPTVLFQAFLVNKAGTMTVKGGMTPHYQDDGRYRMAEELQRRHPDVTTISRKWGRWQHHVDYAPFRGNPLRLRPDAVVPEGVNEYGMRLEVPPANHRLRRLGSASDQPLGLDCSDE